MHESDILLEKEKRKDERRDRRRGLPVAQKEAEGTSLLPNILYLRVEGFMVVLGMLAEVAAPAVGVPTPSGMGFEVKRALPANAVVTHTPAFKQV
jgi:hypothetical protein